MKKPQSELPEYRSVVSLIPGGTMQFLDLGFDLRKIPRLKTEFLEQEIQTLDDFRIDVFLRCLTRFDDDDFFVDLQTGEPVVNPRTGHADKTIQPNYSLSLEKALAPFLGKWVPLPFLRSEGNIGGLEMRYRNGPTDWCRAIVQALSEPDRQGNTHRLVIAFDTHVQSDIDVTNVSNEEGYASLSAMDMHDGAEFSLVTQFKSYAWFLALDWTNDWLRELFNDSVRKKHPNRPIRESDFQYRYEHLARYIGFIELLGACGAVPKVKLTDLRRHSSAIDVDLVLDIGNSRTIGMLIEKRPGESLSLDNGSILELRDLSNPTEHHSDTFNSYVCFSKARFGDPHGYSRGSGRYRPSFGWPSVVRVGPEAVRLGIGSRREEGQTSMSSPKRYLWDLKPRVQEWRYAPDLNDPSSSESPVNSGDFVGFINNEGTPLHVFGTPTARSLEFIKGQAEFPVTEPKFSRSSMMMFLIAEIFTHALVQLNSPSQRNNRLNPDIPRRLRSVILTTPAAMSVSEKILYEYWVKWAVDIVWKSLEWDSYSKDQHDYRFKPNVRMDLDEASSTQLVFVFNEIEKRFSGDSNQYFKIFGKIRERYVGGPSLRVASIDIGGGTTDMVITTYLSESAGATNILVPHQEFREGFNIAGDDILKVVIEDHLIPELIRFLNEHDPSINRETVMRRLGRDAVDLTEKSRNLRAQFAQQLLVPLAFEIFSKLEKLPIEDLPSLSNFQISLRDILSKGHGIDANVLEFVERLVTEENDSRFDLLSWCPTLDLSSVGTSITATISPYLLNLAEVIKLWDCDFVILSGRPSCLPSIQAILHKFPPVQPSRIIAMSNYEVESWYPFWTTLDGKIEDPKTTGVVGALLFAVSEGNLQNFHIRTSGLKAASTIKYIGSMGSDKQIKNKFLLFDGKDISQIRDEELTCTLPFQTQTFIGFRQMNVERWKTTPFYQLCFSDQRAADHASRRGPYEVTLSYSRRFNDEEDPLSSRYENEGILKIVEITDKEGATVPRSDLILSLKSLWDESHWLDTGLFEIN
jgi:hypothetical protein